MLYIKRTNIQHARSATPRRAIKRSRFAATAKAQPFERSLKNTESSFATFHLNRLWQKKVTLDDWRGFFENKGVDETLSARYLQYIDKLLKNNVPVIFDFDHLRKLLGRSPAYLASVINGTDSHYREFKLPKRSGGYRNISVPYTALMECQYWIYHNILLKIRINQSAHGFTKRRSIITNASRHLCQDALLKVDIKEFFPSIAKPRVLYMFKKLGYTTRVSFYLSSLCCLDDSLPQGAPTSPFISNIIARDLDKRLYLLSKEFKLNYSRYADDLTFSGKRIPARFIDYVTKIVGSEGFSLNKEKTRLYKNKCKRIVTGLSVAQEVVKLPRKYKRQLKQEIHFINNFGIESHTQKKKIRNPNYLNSIIGKLNFWLSVEPDNRYAKESLEKLYIIKDNTGEYL